MFYVGTKDVGTPFIKLFSDSTLSPYIALEVYGCTECGKSLTSPWRAARAAGLAPLSTTAGVHCVQVDPDPFSCAPSYATWLADSGTIPGGKKGKLDIGLMIQLLLCILWLSWLDHLTIR